MPLVSHQPVRRLLTRPCTSVWGVPGRMCLAGLVMGLLCYSLHCQMPYAANGHDLGDTCSAYNTKRQEQLRLSVTWASGATNLVFAWLCYHPTAAELVLVLSPMFFFFSTLTRGVTGEQTWLLVAAKRPTFLVETAEALNSS
ncbi:hypothetical protein K504DRAFT_139853 [Pleomassaria siparia CBS 279.74]|uniref:Uncharacterized protein n=1 Tax=Pleomassaria siparia CBS 279.74 TaxID=1314801 RepID=A0A6G1KLN7_9PLEO|nr:hypothetical protein K504DRAFT_139853 [Pleomassaria siparia CBS 279.74]